jgi:hypothetical protein
MMNNGQKGEAHLVSAAKILRAMISPLSLLPLSPKGFCFRGLVLPYMVKQVAKRQAKQCTALVLPYMVKQVAKRQAKQCTALFCVLPPLIFTAPL